MFRGNIVNLRLCLNKTFEVRTVELIKNGTGCLLVLDREMQEGKC